MQTTDCETGSVAQPLGLKTLISLFFIPTLGCLFSVVLLGLERMVPAMFCRSISRRQVLEEIVTMLDKIVDRSKDLYPQQFDDLMVMKQSLLFEIDQEGTQ